MVGALIGLVTTLMIFLVIFLIAIFANENFLNKTLTNLKTENPNITEDEIKFYNKYLSKTYAIEVAWLSSAKLIYLEKFNDKYIGILKINNCYFMEFNCHLDLIVCPDEIAIKKVKNNKKLLKI